MKKISGLALLLFGLSACGAKEAPRPRLPAPIPPTEEALWDAPEGTRIGLLLPLGGPYGRYGESVLNGISCAAGLYGPCPTPHRPLRLIVRDTQGMPPAAAAQELIEQEKVSALIGPLLSQEVEAVAAIAQDKKVPLIVLAPQSKTGTHHAYFFQHSLTPEKEIAQIIQRTEAMDLKHFILFFPENQYGRQYKNLFQQGVGKETGGEILSEAAYPADLPDFTETLRPLLAKLPGEKQIGLFIPDSFRSVVKIAEALKTLNPANIQLIGTSRWHHPKLLGQSASALEGALIDTPFDPSHELTRPFYENFLAAFGMEPAWLEAIGFDAAGLIGQAIQNQGSDAPVAVREGLAAIENFPAVVGPLSWDKEGVSDWPLDFLTIRNGEFVPLP